MGIKSENYWESVAVLLLVGIRRYDAHTVERVAVSTRNQTDPSTSRADSRRR